MMGLAQHLKRIFNIKSNKKSSRDKSKKIPETNNEAVSENPSSNPSSNQLPGSRIESGREYTVQKNVQYILPKDAEELDRLHQQHWMLKVAFQGNFEAPVEEDLKRGIKVLDSGCGPATWTLEMAEEYPNSQFYGLDMAPVFPEQIKPANCEFQLGNLNETLPYPDNYFDYIHQRLLVAGLTTEGWDKALTELIRVLKPGGWLELKEIQFTAENMGPRLSSLCITLGKILESKGMRPNAACELEGYLKGKGLENVTAKKLSVPVNHGGKLGALHWADTQEILTSLKPVIQKVDPVNYKDDEAFEQGLADIGKESAEYLTVGNWFDAYGRKPLA